jgi:hypothetical protein
VPGGIGCHPFVYGGCGGNANRFGTREACERRCPPQVVQSQKTGRDLAPPQQGTGHWTYPDQITGDGPWGQGSWVRSFLRPGGPWTDPQIEELDTEPQIWNPSMVTFYVPFFKVLSVGPSLESEPRLLPCGCFVTFLCALHVG